MNIREFFEKAAWTALLACMTFTVNAQHKYHPKLWYTGPADATAKDTSNGWVSDPEWLKALPLGNGYIGAMVFGDVNKERIQLSEKSLWSGSRGENDNPDASKYISEIRSLLFAGKYKEATELTNKTQICRGVGSGQGNGGDVPYGCSQTLGDLWIDFGKDAAYKNYYRALDLINGIAITKYEQNRIVYTREAFASYPEKALIIRLTASKPRSLSFTITMDRPERFTTTAAGGRLVMTGALSNGKGGAGMKYTSFAVPLLTGGSLKNAGNKLIVSNATAVTIIVTASTNYRLHYPDYINSHYRAELETITKNVLLKNYQTLRQNHIKDFSSCMLRSTLELDSNAGSNIPTNELLDRNNKTKDELALYSLYYQYGRYLLLSSSRKGSLSANLQGIWVNKIQTPWNGDYHIDINVQMNYWPAEVTNLSDCHMPLINLIESLVEPGSGTAKIQYNMHGWCVHPITNVWGYTSPGEQPTWGMHVGATAWLCQHLWEHYAFTNDTQYLQRVWPVMEEACRFYFDWLVKDPKTGKLVSGPATSPENTFIATGGTKAQMSMGPSHDQEVIFNLFTNTIKAEKVLQIKGVEDFMNRLQETVSQLARPGIGSDGRLMEWSQEFKEVDPQHRHVSHLWGLYPGNEISDYNTPDLAEAARRSLETRGDGGNGWSLAWKIDFWARLHDGDHALQLLNNLLRPTTEMGTLYDKGGGSYYNLFDACPPFQIDGNFGATAGIAEMLLQSQQGFIELLPALPHNWHTGSVTGLCARGAFVVDIKWSNGELSNVLLHARKGGSVTLRYAGQIISIQTKPGDTFYLNSKLKIVDNQKSVRCG
ncbi:glycoside hydrolase family 95 protein [Chitinophagaceae bacterium 26-R-25]|nr:glycoside hydrolase family 95 protein [Chitinophagaceae bacterium 26-R-25]